MPDQYERLRIARDSFKDLAAESAMAADRYARENATLRAERDKLRSDLAAAMIQISDLAQAKGEAEGRLRASEMVGVVEGWRDRATAAEDSLREREAEIGRLRAALSNERRHRSMAENTAEHWRRRYDDLCNGPAETDALSQPDRLHETATGGETDA